MKEARVDRIYGDLLFNGLQTLITAPSNKRGLRSIYAVFTVNRAEYTLLVVWK
jgi:hypothetical protein